MTLAESFLRDIDAFLTRTGMSPTAFGRSALNDPNFVGDLRNGRKPNLGLVERVQTFIHEHDVSRATSESSSCDGEENSDSALVPDQQQREAVG